MSRPRVKLSDARSNGRPRRLFLTASVTNSSISFPRCAVIPCAIAAADSAGVYVYAVPGSLTTTVATETLFESLIGNAPVTSAATVIGVSDAVAPLT